MMRRLTRRRFLQLAASGTALGVAGRSSFAQADAPDEQPCFRFVQWNDLHVDATPSRARRAEERVKYLVEWLNLAEHAARYDFVVGVGDLIHGGNSVSLAADTQRLRNLIADLKIPFHPVLGNHENMGREGEPTYESPFCEAFRLDRTNYTQPHKDFLFVMLNNSGDPRSKGTPVGRRRKQWFRRVLEASNGVPKIVCCHIPLVPVRDDGVLAKNSGFTSSSHVASDDELLKLVDRHANSVVAVLSGHLHLTGAMRRNGVHHIVVAGTASHPCDFATYDVFADRIHVRVHGLPARLLSRDADIHRRPRHRVDYTDAAHPTHESYIMGNASERDFEIGLTQRPLGSRAT